jgi:hypothetical protein
MPQVFLSWEKISKTSLEKVFFLLCAVSSLFGVLCPKVWKTALLRGTIFFLEIGHIGYKKKQKFYADLKCKYTYLRDKMLPKKSELIN